MTLSLQKFIGLGPLWLRLGAGARCGRSPARCRGSTRRIELAVGAVAQPEREPGPRRRHLHHPAALRQDQRGGARSSGRRGPAGFIRVATATMTTATPTTISTPMTMTRTLRACMLSVQSQGHGEGSRHRDPAKVMLPAAGRGRRRGCRREARPIPGPAALGIVAQPAQEADRDGPGQRRRRDHIRPVPEGQTGQVFRLDPAPEVAPATPAGQAMDLDIVYEDERSDRHRQAGRDGRPSRPRQSRHAPWSMR